MELQPKNKPMQLPGRIEPSQTGQPAQRKHPGTVTIRVWRDEHDWLHGLYRSAENNSPAFRLPDLVSACVSLAASAEDGHVSLLQFLNQQLILRSRSIPKRACVIWQQQFELLVLAHRAPWNSFPNPRFDIDQLTTACIAVCSQAEDASVRVFHQARLNVLARTAAAH